MTSKVSACSLCDAQCTTEDLEKYSFEGKSYCSPECIKWSVLGDNTKAKAVNCVVESLKFLASNDDLYVGHNFLYKLVESRHHQECPDRKYGRLWVKEAIKSGKVVEFKVATAKKKILSLPKYQKEIMKEDAFPSVLDAEAEEQFVLNLLWDEGHSGGLDRKYVADKLQSTFDAMKTPLQRNRVLLNAQANGKLHICKGPFLHVVGLTKEQAEASLEYEMNKMQKDKGEMQKKDENVVVQNHDMTNGTSDASNESRGKNGDNFENDKKNVNQNNDDESIGSDASSSSSEIDLGAMLATPKLSARLSVRSSSPTDSGEKIAKTKTNTTIPPGIVIDASPAKEKTQEPAKPNQFLLRRDENGNCATKNLHVSGYGDKTTKQDIYSLFRQVCRIVEVVPRYSGTYSYMFVNTHSIEDAIAARKEMTGKVLNGGRLKINFAKD